MFEPNGRALAYVSDETGQLEVYVRAYPSLDRRVRVSSDGGIEPVWSRSGTELFYRNGRQYFSVPVSHAGETIKNRPTVPDVRGKLRHRILFPGYPSYDVSPDGRRFITVMPAADTPQIGTGSKWSRPAARARAPPDVWQRPVIPRHFAPEEAGRGGAASRLLLLVERHGIDGLTLGVGALGCRGPCLAIVETTMV